VFCLPIRSEERKTSLLTLIKKAREEKPEVWDEYFNAVLLILLETLGDVDVSQSVRCVCGFFSYFVLAIF
jgi:hypothetical protein